MKIYFSKSIKKIFWDNFLIRWVGNILGLYLANFAVEGIYLPKEAFWVFVLAGFVFAVFNIFLKPALMLFSISAIIFTFGLFTFVINGFLLYLVSLVVPYFKIENFLAAILAAIIISVVNFVMSIIFDDFKMEVL